MRGRKPKPTSQQLSEGDPRKLGVHKLEQKLEAEAKASRGLPKCPPHLKGRARKAWRFWSEELANMNLDARPDAMMLEGACIAYQAAIEAYETIQKQGALVAKRILDPDPNWTSMRSKSVSICGAERSTDISTTGRPFSPGRTAAGPRNSTGGSSKIASAYPE